MSVPSARSRAVLRSARSRRSRSVRRPTRRGRCHRTEPGRPVQDQLQAPPDLRRRRDPARGRRGRPRRKPGALVSDRGDDHDKYRVLLHQRGTRPLISRRGHPRQQPTSALGRRTNSRPAPPVPPPRPTPDRHPPRRRSRVCSGSCVPNGPGTWVGRPSAARLPTRSAFRHRKVVQAREIEGGVSL